MINIRSAERVALSMNPQTEAQKTWATHAVIADRGDLSEELRLYKLRVEGAGHRLDNELIEFIERLSK